jgi:hypothetical protein
MTQYRPYLIELSNILANVEMYGITQRTSQRLMAAIDGQAVSELRRLVPLDIRRQSGLFFTGSTLAERVLRRFSLTFDKNSRILDPTCGAGDLLIACLKLLPKESTAKASLALWNQQLRGIDLQATFVQAAKIRLQLASLARLCKHNIKSTKAQLFPNLVCGDVFDSEMEIKDATHVVLNPPYILIEGEKSQLWGKGKLNSAAVFFQYIIENASPGAHVLAILPDVLRSGERYRKWRANVAKKVIIHEIELLGLFDPSTDIDVFSINIEIPKDKTHFQNYYWGTPCVTPQSRIGDYFDVKIGSVVDYRDPHKGSYKPYIVSRELPHWKSITTIKKHRRFSGRLFCPPFVAIRRTSRLGDAHRAIGTIILGKTPVAVENHLIVLKPINGSIKECQTLLAQLKNKSTDDWLNDRIRCRHLTISSIVEAPYNRGSK